MTTISTDVAFGYRPP